MNILTQIIELALPTAVNSFNRDGAYLIKGTDIRYFTLTSLAKFYNWILSDVPVSNKPKVSTAQVKRAYEKCTFEASNTLRNKILENHTYSGVSSSNKVQFIVFDFEVEELHKNLSGKLSQLLSLAISKAAYSKLIDEYLGVNEDRKFKEYVEHEYKDAYHKLYDTLKVRGCGEDEYKRVNRENTWHCGEIPQGTRDHWEASRKQLLTLIQTIENDFLEISELSLPEDGAFAVLSAINKARNAVTVDFDVLGLPDYSAKQRRASQDYYNGKARRNKFTR